MGRALKLSLLTALLAAALLAYACGKSHVAGSGAIQAANSNSPQSLENAQAALDALACPDGVDAALWAQLKAALKTALRCRARTCTAPTGNDGKAANGGVRVPALQKTVSTPPSGEANRVNDLAIADNGDGTYTLSWHYRNLGDYDQNGAVAVEDIIPLAQHFGETWASGEENTLPAVIDGSANGRIGIEDITPLAVNIGSNVDHYAIEGAQAQDGAWEAVTEVAQSTGAGDGRLAFEYALSDTPFRWYRAVPADTASAPGDSSNAVLSPAFQEWVHTWGSGDTDEGKDLVVDESGNVYVVGYTGNYSTNEQDLLLLKYSYNGALLWQKTWDDSYNNTASGIALDNSGNFCVVGWSRSFISGLSYAFFLKFSPQGELLTQESWNSQADEDFSDIAVDSSDNVYVSGGTNGFGAGFNDVLLLKLTSEGDPIWQKTWGRVGFDSTSAICCDSEGNVYVTGHTRDLRSVENGVLLLKLSADGEPLWIKTWGDSSYEQALDLAIGADNEIYVVGRTARYEYGGYGDAFILKYSDDGTLLWQKTWGGDYQDTAYSVVAGTNGSVYVTGYTTQSEINAEVFLLEYSSDGILIGQRKWESPNGIEPYSLTEGRNGLLYLTGVGFNALGSWAPTANSIPFADRASQNVEGTFHDIIGNQSTLAGTVETPSGIEDIGGGYLDVLIMKIDPMRWE